MALARNRPGPKGGGVKKPRRPRTQKPAPPAKPAEGNKNDPLPPTSGELGSNPSGAIGTPDAVDA